MAISSSPDTLPYWIQRFEHALEVERHCSAHTRQGYRADLAQWRAYLTERFQSDPPGVALLTRPAVRGFLSHLLRHGYSPRSIARKQATLRSFARYLVRESVLPVNPLIALRTPRLPKRLPDFLSREEVQELLRLPDSSSFTGLRDSLVLKLFYVTGVRISEAAQLQVADVQLWDGALRVHGKRDKTRLLPLGRHMIQLLQAYLPLRQEIARHTPPSGGPLLLTDAGEPYTRQQLARVIRGYMLRVVDPDKAHPHALRHSFATHLLDEGAEILAVKELLGHASLSTTQIYTHVSAEHLRRVYKQAHPRAEKE
ncbi:MAG TPA: tyrosine recombinase XerC [bacterium]|nr:tyrosine recombinase XerC [bacterium]HQG45324.1 tyrosine recombinase XerC [bacterium]HQI49603.1 tyrosine recombinase XerC [bacterium]HQJ64043.1 tyrosine recombinase XerC [bacterium]